MFAVYICVYIYVRVCQCISAVFSVKKLQPIKRDENVSLRPSTAPMKGGSGKKQQQQQQQLTQPPLDRIVPQDNSKVRIYIDMPTYTMLRVLNYNQIGKLFTSVLRHYTTHPMSLGAVHFIRVFILFAVTTGGIPEIS